MNRITQVINRNKLIKFGVGLMLVSVLTVWAPEVGRAETAPDQTNTMMVIVKRGDSLWKISRRQFPDQDPWLVISQIQQLNKLGKYIHPGQQLILPREFPAKKKPVSTVSRGVPGRTMACQATAYCYTGNRTATMTWPQAGRTIAVDPNVIPLRSRVYVTCNSWPRINGVYVAEDTGGLIKGNIIDIYMSSREQAIQWGRRTVEVKILE